MTDRTELRVTLACGVSRCGKTIFFLRYLASRSDLVCRFIFDPLGKMAEACGLVCAESEAECEFAVEEDGWVFFDPATMFPGDDAAGFDWFCRWSYGHAQRLCQPTALLCDEVWMYQNRHKLPQPLACWIQNGAKFRCEVLLATHDPHKLNSSLEGQLTEIVCFYLQGDKQLDFVQRLGFDRAEIASLQNGAFVSRDPRLRTELRARLW
jgi:hypothetical protein